MKAAVWTRGLSPIVLLIALIPASVHAQNSSQQTPAAASTGGGIGVDVFGGAGIGWPAASDSFDALDLNSTPFEFGGGVRLTGLRKKLFAQFAVSRWSDDGERAFIDSEGESFPLGIPLEVRATFLDATLGVKDTHRNSTGRTSFLTYVGVGAGVVRYRESSPFAEPGDDIDTTEPSYHVMAGVEVPVTSWLAAVVDGRYRFIPGILGDAGASAVLEEDALGGFHVSAGLRVGFGGQPYRTPVRSAPATPPPAAVVPPATPPSERPPEGVFIEAAPVYILPDTSRTPLRTLPAGTPFKVLEQAPDWVRIEFHDVQFGRRVGYVQRKFVQVR